MTSLVVESLDRTELRAGLTWGIVVGCVAFGVAWVLCHRTRRPAPVVGVALGIAVAIALERTLAMPSGLRAGLLLLAVCGAVADALGRPVLIGMPAAVPGAFFVAGAAPDVPSWGRVLVWITIVVGGSLVAAFDLRHGALGAAPALFALATFGVFATVPDTEHALVLLGAAAPLVLLAWPVPHARLGAAGALVAVATLAWTAAVDGVGRPAAIVGAVASLGLLLSEPVARAIVRIVDRRTPPSALDRLPRRLWTVPVIAMAQAVVVFVTARVGGLDSDVIFATVVCAAALACTVVVGVALTPRPARVRA